MKKILWASPNTLLDSANGAALSIREILTQLSKNDFEIKILGATIVVNPNGMSFLNQFSQVFKENLHKFIKIKDDNLEHQLLITETIFRRRMLSFEEKIWFDEYCRILDEFKPDFVFFFDNSLITYLTASEAKHRGITTVVYLAHCNNRGKRWQRDVDLILTDSHATAELYKKRENYTLIPIGKFIPQEKYKATSSKKENILFINPSLEKGVIVVIQLALYLEKIRPEIKFEIVESRSSFKNILKTISNKIGKERDSLSNIILTPNNNDMKPIYGRSKIVLVPSLSWESSSRVIVEAMINGIPIVATNRGGTVETLGNCGFLINLDSKYYDEPYNTLLQEYEIIEIAKVITKLYDDKEFYEKISKITLDEYDKKHNIYLKTENLINILKKSQQKN